MESYDTLLNKLRTTPPVLKNPEKLTRRVLKEIEHTPQQTKSKILPLISGIAASLILIWMITEINYQPNFSLQTSKTETTNLMDTHHLPVVFPSLTAKEKRTLFYSELKNRMKKQKRMEQITQKMKDHETK